MPCLKAGQALSETERARYLADARALDAYLIPASLEEAATTLVLPLKSVRVSRDGSAISDAIAAQYAEALEGLPRRAMDDARRAINRGEAPGIDPKFLPTPTELAVVVKEFEAAARFERRWIDHILALTEGPEEDGDPIVAAAAQKIAAAAVTSLRQSFAERSLEERQAEVTRIASLETERRAREARVNADIAARRATRESVDLPCDVEPTAERGSG